MGEGRFWGFRPESGSFSHARIGADAGAFFAGGAFLGGAGLDLALGAGLFAGDFFGAGRVDFFIAWKNGAAPGEKAE